jgi:pimeloyl-ACP methyl ester carboxylesterase
MYIREDAVVDESRIWLNDLDFTYLAAGPSSGEPVVLLHGFPQFADVWTSLSNELGA